MPAEDAAALIASGSTIGMSGFTGAGYPKAVPGALAQRIMATHGAGRAISRWACWTGASTAPELDGALAAADGIDMRMPYQSDPVTRAKINARRHGLSRYASVATSRRWSGKASSGKLDIALVEVSPASPPTAT